MFTDNSAFKVVPVPNVFNSLYTENEKFKELISKTKQYRQIRNHIVHGSMNISKEEATDIVKNVDEVCKAIKNGDIIFKNR